MLGRSKLKIQPAETEGGAVVEMDQSNLRQGDEENDLALVSEWSEWERNLAFEQEKWKSWALQTVLESSMFWA